MASKAKTAKRVVVPACAKAQYRKLLKRVADAEKADHDSKLPALIGAYLRSFHVMLVSTYAANAQLPKPYRIRSAAELKSIAERLNPFAGTKEPVRVYLRPKKSNHDERRIICDYGIERRALQYAVLPLLRILAEPKNVQFGTKGVGKAVQAVRQAIGQGMDWGIELDIKDCFHSFNAEAVARLLPLPKEVIHHTLLNTHSTLVPGNLEDIFGPADDPDNILLRDALADARRGIPQGSSTSPLVAELMLSLTFAEVPLSGIAVNYADNTLLLGKQWKDVESDFRSLRSALLAHPAGRLWPTYKTFNPNFPIFFLGHKFVRTNDAVVVSPSNPNMSRFYYRMNKHRKIVTLASSNPIKCRRQKGKAGRYVRSWWGAFRECDAAAARRAANLNEVRDW